mgnify:CR=1 FL=1
MKIAVSSDERTVLTDFVVAELEKRGHTVLLFGPLMDEPMPWTRVTEQAANAVAAGEAEEGVFFCYTGTGAAIAANKVNGIRAALCQDAETARGARWWNDANALVLSNRAVSLPIAAEILDAWFSERVKDEEKDTIRGLREIEQKNRRG